MSEEIKMKTCGKCKREFPANNTYYFNDSKKQDGLFLTCKECEGYNFQDIKNQFKSSKIGYKICRKCLNEYPLDSDHYMRNSAIKDGYSNFCKVCDGYKFTFKLVEEGYKVCIKCENKLELNKSNFHADNDNKDGFSNICKDCKTFKNKDGFNIETWYDSKSDKFKNKWNFRDIKWMYENYPIVTKQDLLNYFNNRIKYKTLTNIIYQWDLRKIEKNDNWSQEDIQFLKENYPNMPQKELQKRFKNRTWDSIKNKASKLNINRDEETLTLIKSESHKGIKPSKESRIKMGLARKGEKAWNWKGGVSPLHPYLRDKISNWKLDSLAKYDYKCALTNINDRTLQVHHLNKNFSEIIQETFSNLKLKINGDMTIYTTDQLIAIDNEFRRLHYHYGLGVPLIAKLHSLFHSLYGNVNNTPNQFEEFKLRFRMGEFDELINKKVGDKVG